MNDWDAIDDAYTCEVMQISRPQVVSTLPFSLLSETEIW